VISGIFRRRTAYLRRRQTELERHIAIRTAELQAANQRLSQMATTDPLTGCATRRHFMERANGLIELGRRGLPTCLAIMDLDNFKSINDRHGHPIGDEVLRHAAQVFRAQLRASDLIGRIGGEEFAVMMPNTGAAEALVFVDRLRDALAKADFTVAGATVRTSVSVGLAEQRPLEDFAALYARADAALYTAKSRGRNRVVAADCAPSPAPADCSRCGSADCVCG
jgi:diguanylate cyclase (GGDEF)-like protein